MSTRSSVELLNTLLVVEVFGLRITFCPKKFQNRVLFVVTCAATKEKRLSLLRKLRRPMPLHPPQSLSLDLDHMEEEKDDEEVDHKFEICFIGPSRAGKTAVCRNWAGEEYSDEYIPTSDYSSRRKVNRPILQKNVKMTLLDTPGSKKYLDDQKLNDAIAKCDGVVLVFDLTKYYTLQKMEAYWNHIMKANPTALTILVGNKSDDVEGREVKDEEAKELANKLCCESYFAVSAKNNSGLNGALQCLSASCMLASNPSSPAKVGTNFRRISIFSPTNASGDEEKAGFGRARAASRASKKFDQSPIKSYMVDAGQWYLALGERDAFLHAFRETLRKGVTVLVYPHAGGAPDYAKLLLHKSGKRIGWEGIGHSRVASDGMVINDIAEIRPYTEFSYTFRVMRIPKRSEGTDHLFAIISSKLSVSMAADTPESCIYLVKGLKLLVERAIPSHVKRRRGKEPLSDAKLTLLRSGKKKHESFDDLKLKLSRGLDVVSITKGISQRDLFMFMDTSEKRIIFSRRRKDAVTTKFSVLDSFMLYFEGPDPEVSIDDISEVRPGYSLDSLDSKPPPHPSQEQFALSIIASERTMSILLPSTPERDFYVSKLQALVKATRPSVSVY